jgi:hypothetical protein
VSTLSSSRLLSVLSAGTALVWALPAAAQITADDVVTNSLALYDSLGALQSATLLRDGATVTVQGERLQWTLPMGLGTASVAVGDYTLTENGDGSVTITYPSPYVVTVEGTISGQGSGSIEVIASADADFVTTATGEPGAITYLSQTGPFEIGLGSVMIPDVPGMEGATFEFSYTAESSETLTRVVEDSLLLVVSETTIGPSTTYSLVAGPDFRSISDASYGTTTTTANMGLIPGGVDLLNLATALRDGMYINGESTSENSDSFSVNYLFDSLSDSQDVSSGYGEASFRFDREGIAVTASVSEVFVTTEQPFIMPEPIGLDLGGVSTGFLVPVLADPAAQDFAFEFTLHDLRLGQPIWAIFDPGKTLDRSPARLGIDISGSVINKVDWLDFMGLDGVNIDIELPGELTSLTIADLSLAALGAQISGQGAFTFDAGDTFTYPGFPRPTGEASLDGVGVNTAIDMLANAGVIPSDALLGLRMGLGMISVPGPEPDTLSSRIEMTADGKIMANGMQLR